MRAMSRADKPTTVNQYLASVSPEKRASLQKLRQVIRAAIPAAEECISYGIPAYRLGGRMMVAFGAAAKHCSFYCGSTPIEVHADALSGYGTSRGTVRFAADRPLPAALVRRLVKTQVTARTGGRGAARGPKPKMKRS